MRIIYLISLMLAFIKINAQEKLPKGRNYDHSSKKTIEYCLNTVLHELYKNPSVKPISPFSSSINNCEILKRTGTDLWIKRANGDTLKLLPEIRNRNYWDIMINWEKARFTTFKYCKTEFLIITSHLSFLSGLITNFNRYVIIDLNNGRYTSVISLSDDYRLFYLHNNKLIFYLFDWSEEFLNTKDYDNISLEISNNCYDQSNNTISVLSKYTSKCNN